MYRSMAAMKRRTLLAAAAAAPLAVPGRAGAQRSRVVRFIPLGKVQPNMLAIMLERLAGTPPGTMLTEMVGSGPFRCVVCEAVLGSAYNGEQVVMIVGSGIPDIMAASQLVAEVMRKRLRSARMRQALADFVRHGEPRIDPALPWPPYTPQRRVVQFSQRIAVLHSGGHNQNVRFRPKSAVGRPGA